MRAGEGVATDHSPAGVSIRSRVHEYGGGAVCLLPRSTTPSTDGAAFAYVDQADQRVWCSLGPDATPLPLTPAAPPGQTWHHGGLSASADGQWVLAVREVHRHHGNPDGQHPPRPRRSIVALSVHRHRDATDDSASDESTLLEGHDFYGTAFLHPEGDRVVATTWDHPDMPWDASRVIVTALQRQTDADTGTKMLVPAGHAMGDRGWAG